MKLQILLSTVISFVSSFLGFLSQLLLARVFGIGYDIDVFFASLSLPTFLVSLVTAGVMYQYLPKIILDQESLGLQNNEIKKLLGTLYILSFIFACGVFFIDWQIQLFSNPNTNETVSLELAFLIGWLLASIQVLTVWPMAILSARKQYYSSSVISWFQYAGSIIILLIISNPSIIEVLAGILVCSVAGLFYGHYKIRKYVDFSYALKLKDCISSFNAYILQLPYSAIGLSCFSSYTVIDAYWAPRIGEGVLGYIGYAQRLVIGVGNLAIMGIFTVSSHEFAYSLAKDGLQSFKRTLNKLTFFSLLSSAFVAFIIYFCIQDIIGVIYSSKNFTEKNVLLLSQSVIIMLPGMIGMLISTVLMKGLFCLSNSNFPKLIIGIAWPVSYFVLIYITKGLGLKSLAYSYSAVWMLFSVFLYIYINNKK